jgi:hypothetical protein
VENKSRPTSLTAERLRERDAALRRASEEKYEQFSLQWK